MKKFPHYLTLSLLALTTLLWLSSYTHRTSVGIDHDFEQANDKVLHTFSRLSWTGHGSIWLGYSSTIKDKREGVALEKLDIAAVFFKRVKTPLDPSVSVWNKLGFWYIHGQSPNASLWLGIPSWLPVLLIALFMRKKRELRVNEA
ncbi:hypothetical protein EOL70_15590 [Leucothrix sargassi]|nr:hypothetical protein EOL70_15590 [Leucothrix sargassi]